MNYAKADDSPFLAFRSVPRRQLHSLGSSIRVVPPAAGTTRAVSRSHEVPTNHEVILHTSWNQKYKQHSLQGLQSGRYVCLLMAGMFFKIQKGFRTFCACNFAKTTRKQKVAAVRRRYINSARQRLSTSKVTPKSTRSLGLKGTSLTLGCPQIHFLSLHFPAVLKLIPYKL